MKHARYLITSLLLCIILFPLSGLIVASVVGGSNIFFAVNHGVIGLILWISYSFYHIFQAKEH